jgi:hypothetical protein
MLIGIWGETLLERQEHIIGGQVVRSSGSIDSDGDFTLKLDYSFFSPTGNQIIHGSAQQARNNLNGEALPAQGAPLAILFRKDNHHKPF